MAYPGSVIDLQVQADGTLKDTVSGTLATITRAGSKYGIDPVTGLLGSVGANLLYPEKYPNGGGYWAAIEEARTNYLLNSSLESGSSPLATYWNNDGNNPSLITRTVESSGGADGGKFQRLAMAGIAGSGSAGIMSDQWTGIVATESATFSPYLRESTALVGCGLLIIIYWYKADGTYISLASSAVTPTSSWARYSVTATAPALAAQFRVGVQFTGIDTGDTGVVDVDAVQLEKGAFPTSYIPTTTAAVTRPADVVTFPSTALSATQGTLCVVCGQTPTTSGHVAAMWFQNVDNRYGIDLSGGNFRAVAVGNSTMVAALKARTTGIHSIANAWTVGGNVTAYADGVPGTPLSLTYAMTAPPASFHLGQLGNDSAFWNAPLHRLVAFDSALSDEAVATLSAAILAGIGNPLPYLAQM